MVFTRNVMDNTRMLEVHPQFAAWLEANQLNRTDLLEEVANTGGLSRLEEVPEAVRRVFVTSFDIAPEWHVRMQAAFQEFTDNGVSKTINFPEEASREAIAETYRLAFDLGVKGITVYRNNSRQDQPMSLETAPQSEPMPAQEPEQPNQAIRCVECD
jgi:ribonucleoside-diphosphate reductase alpha chain